MTDRRYTDEEISAIFAKAVEGLPPAPPQSPREGGLTLTELQEIGREVGISPDAVAHAARSLDVTPRAASRRVLGLPVGVERTIALGRWVTDAEWEHLVVRLRETFNARGHVSEHGNFRQWTNGNLQALLEPTPTGHRLRLRTTRGSALAGIRAGMAALAMGGVVAIAAALGGHLGSAVPGIVTMVLIGTGMMTFSVLPLANWARVRGRQMDAIASGLASAEDEPAPERSP